MKIRLYWIVRDDAADKGPDDLAHVVDGPFYSREKAMDARDNNDDHYYWQLAVMSADLPLTA